MKKIIITFLTEKGRKAYEEINEAGAAESKVNKRIMKRIARDTVVCKDPLTVEIKIKIPRLAIASEMDKKIIQGLEDKGAKAGRDFDLKVEW